MYFFFREIVGEIWKEKLRTFFVKSMKTVLTKFFSLLCCKTTYAHFTENSFSRETAKSPSWQTITDFTKKFNEIIPRAFHSVEKCYKTRSRFLRKNQHFFREINVFTKKVTKELISRFFFFFAWSRFILLFHTVHSILNFFRKIKVFWRKFCTELGSTILISRFFS